MKRLISIILLLTLISGCLTALSEETWVFILCNPKTPVNIRKSPKNGGEKIGRLDFGDSVKTDGKKKNGFLHVVDITEEGQGWIFAGYVVKDQPVKCEKTRANIAATGRVMSYRWIGGRKNCWLHICDEVQVLAMSEEWAVTNKGYIRTKYLEVWYE